MEQSTLLRQMAWTVAMLVAAFVLTGCEGRQAELPDEQPSEETSLGNGPRQPEGRGELLADPEPEAEPGPGPQRTPEAEPEEPQRKAEPGPEPSTEPDPETEPEAGPVVEPEPTAKPEPMPEPGPTPESEPGEPAPEPAGMEGRKMLDLGPPLVKDLKSLIRLDKTRPIWLDKANKRVLMIGLICQREAPLELFACVRNTKEHEAIVSVDVEAVTVHAGLLAVKAKPGKPASWDPNYVPATGTEIEVTVVWNDKQGKRQTARAQDWILDTGTKKAMTHPWVFAGSRFWQDEETGKKYYEAEGGDLICVSNFPSALLDLPIESSQANESLLFRAFTERIPPLGTPVTLLLTPKLEQKKKAEKAGQEGGEKKAD